MENWLKANSVDLLWDQGLSPWMSEGDYPSVASLPGIQDYVTIMGELWPGTGLERFYLGYIAGPDKWMKVLKTQKQVLSICTNAQIQFAAIEAFPNFQDQPWLPAQFACRKPPKSIYCIESS